MSRRPPRQSKAARRPTGGGAGQTNQIRIIGGMHRGRRLSFPDSQGLRPTSDRTRETLFNWLQPRLPGARCLDLFAGSGALGFEAASRGAASVTLLDRHPGVTRQLEANCALLGMDRMTIIQADAITWLDQPAEPFDIIFLDPPFADGLLTTCCDKLEEGGWLSPDCRLYLEWDLHGPSPELPARWLPLREKKAGQVVYGLYGG